MLAVLIAVAVAVERSPLVAVSEVRVAGTDRVPEVAAAADIPLGTSTLRIRVRRAAQRVTELPFVRSATVRRVDPLTVSIEVEERRPVLALTDGRRAVRVDEDGVVVDTGRPGDLPLVRVAGEPLPELGTELAGGTSAANAFAVHVGLPGTMRSAIDRYEALGPDDVALLLDGGVKVRFGRASRVAEKARVLGAILPDVGEGDVVDVRAPANPVVVPVAAADAPPPSDASTDTTY